MTSRILTVIPKGVNRGVNIRTEYLKIISVSFLLEDLFALFYTHVDHVQVVSDESLQTNASKRENEKCIILQENIDFNPSDIITRTGIGSHATLFFPKDRFGRINRLKSF